jgi:DNA-binding CsgD family transcriptional regulator
MITLSIVRLLELRGRNIAEGFEKATVVEPVHPFQSAVFDGIDVPPRTLRSDELSLVQADDRLGQRIVVGVSSRSNRSFDTALSQSLSISNGQILGAFNRSSQHHKETEVAMNAITRRSGQAQRAKLRSPGRPPVLHRSERRPFWRAISEGFSSEDAARRAGISQPIGTRWFRECGGMPPSHLAVSASLPTIRYLSLIEREQIALLRAHGDGVREIARNLRRAPSTISRELRRNAATRSGGFEYRAITAQWHADRAARRPKPAKLAVHTALRTYVQERLAGRVVGAGGKRIAGPVVRWNGRRHGPRQHRRWARAWSPEQIAQRLAIDFPEDSSMRISHEAIYQSLYIQGRGALRRELSTVRQFSPVAVIQISPPG